ncbi:ATP-binding protein [uncultured Sphingomonas sp.]|uniref:hybrid sensor histidine kinase/response regulator n=1 Tax=uncultured Sphingomonas sp. TaxID=158754 RepID=UPI0025DEF1AF|nr:ATP-binding protein [uncultured Sphingomonas sp.]
MAAVLVLAALTVAVGAWQLLPSFLIRELVVATVGGVVVGGAALIAATWLRQDKPSQRTVRDWSLLSAAFEDAQDAIAITDSAGRPICVNPNYEARFGLMSAPTGLAANGDDPDMLATAARIALREGMADRQLVVGGTKVSLMLRRGGRIDDHLIWRFRDHGPSSDYGVARELLAGSGGDRLGDAGVMMALAEADGTIVAANRVFAYRVFGDADRNVAGANMADLLTTSADGAVRLAREEDDEAQPLRVIPVSIGDNPADGASVLLMFDEDPDAMTAAAARGAATVHLHELLAMLPLGLALVERDGRFLFLNEAFRRAAGLNPNDSAVYPSDIVAEEDKAAVSEAVRRFAGGRALPGDLAVRLWHRAEEPVGLTIANAKGLGDAAVLLSLKDNTEESKLKRQVAQATKMQAVGQLAGGVAHDFNNILTAIIGHCDLMLMRHVPGDIDYDDIQQIKHNSNRAASLTRQLLAFSRQQTLRPQILQLPDVISEVSNLLRRLLGETVKLEVKHGRNLGLVRADPGQLEQVIVNLAVNARDAMPEGGTLTIQTYPVTASEVRKMRSEILPIADYTALKVTDTGTGIAPENLAKIFEPFFTTKEVGKGTGLGLSTVYGIVKQTDGFIFADSEVGAGTSFVIYLPVHHAAKAPEPTGPVRVEPTGEMWGTGTILLVEDEAMVRAVAERALTRQGYQVLTATNGEEALELLLDGAEVDLLISDVVMPTMDGPTLVRTARQTFPDLKVLFMSGYAEEQLRKSIDIERVAFLPKPFSVLQLGQAARDALVPPA